MNEDNMKIVMTNGGNYVLFFTYKESIISECRKLKEKFGWKDFYYSKNLKGWVFNPTHFDEVMKVFPDADISANVRDNEKNKNVIVDKNKKLDTHLPLYDFQKIGAAFAVDNKKIMINDEMGLGKTLQAIAVIDYLKLNDVLVICPNSLKTNWQREIRKWINREAYIINGDIKQNEINIINYEKLSKFASIEKSGNKKKIVDMSNSINRKWQLIIIDESHYIKESKSMRTKLTLELCKNAERVILLSGTPVTNRPKELITQLKAIDKLKDVAGSDWYFLQRYCNAHQTRWGWDFTGASNLDELRKKISNFSIRRLKKDVLKDLPEKFVHTTTLDLPEPIVYQNILQGGKDELQKNKDEYQYFYKSLKGLTEEEILRRLVDKEFSQGFNRFKSSALKVIEKLKQETARQKILISDDLLNPFLESKEKVIVFCTHKKTVYELAKKYPDSVILTGDFTQEERMKNLDEFNNNENKIFLFATMQSAGMGYNITSASYVIFFEYLWTPGDHLQAEDRAHRIGQKNNVDINYLIMNKTIDETIVNMIVEKSKVIGDIFESNDNFSNLLFSKIFIDITKDNANAIDN